MAYDHLLNSCVPFIASFQLGLGQRLGLARLGLGIVLIILLERIAGRSFLNHGRGWRRNSLLYLLLLHRFLKYLPLLAQLLAQHKMRYGSTEPAP
jgi:hypothetical protein